MASDKDLRNMEIRDRIEGELNIIRAIINKQLKIRNEGQPRKLSEIYDDLDKLGLKKEYFKNIRMKDLTQDNVNALEKKLVMYNEKCKFIVKETTTVSDNNNN